MKRNILSIFILLLLVPLLIGCSGFPYLISAAADDVNEPVEAVEATEMPKLPPPDITGLDNLGVLKALDEGFSEVYAQVAPSVVNIQVERISQLSSLDIPNFPLLPGQTPDSQQPREYRQEGLGSGFVWDKEGHIVTNWHVVNDADKIVVTFSDDTSANGEIVGSDRDSDLAVVKVDLPEERMVPIQIADSTQSQVGQVVIAIGNPFGLEGTMTTGIISALGRSLPVQDENIQGPYYTIPDVIQTDAPINPGNSGGVLVDIQGQLIGVTTAIESPVRANAGIGYVIPSTIVKKVVPSLIKTGHYEHPWIGISGTTLSADIADAMGLDKEQHGILVVDVVPDGPADDAGMRGSDRLVTIDEQNVRVGGDIILKIDDQAVQDFEDLTAYLARYTQAGKTVTITVLRNGKEEVLDLTLGVRRSYEEEQQISQGSGAWLGIKGLTITPEVAEAMKLSENQQGVLIQQVIEGSPADEAGLQGSYKSLTVNDQPVLVGGDMITAVGGQSIMDLKELQSFLRESRPGQDVKFTVLRDGRQMDIMVKLGEIP